MKCRLHVNRAEIKKGNGWVWTIHTSKACIRAKSVAIEVPCQTEYRPDLRSNPKVFITVDAQVTDLGKGHFRLHR